MPGSGGVAHQIRPEFASVVSLTKACLTNLQLWAEQLEAAGDHEKPEDLVKSGPGRIAMGTLTKVIAAFEKTARGVSISEAPVHRDFARRELHPLTLCSPFMRHSYQKPLGYPGDFMMVNMIFDDPFRGPSLYARLLNNWCLKQAPAEAHRNRIAMITEDLRREAHRVVSHGRPFRVLNIGCGPAIEITRLVASRALPEDCVVTLVDFSREALDYLRARLDEIRSRIAHAPRLNLVQMSVNQLLKAAMRPDRAVLGGPFDLIYSAGLFDYLSDRVCNKLLQTFVSWLTDDGVVTVTNVHPSNPWIRLMEYVMDWQLIHRDEQNLRQLAPHSSHDVRYDSTGVNMLFSLRKIA